MYVDINGEQCKGHILCLLFNPIHVLCVYMNMYT